MHMIMIKYRFYFIDSNITQFKDMIMIKYRFYFIDSNITQFTEMEIFCSMEHKIMSYQQRSHSCKLPSSAHFNVLKGALSFVSDQCLEKRCITTGLLKDY